MTTTATPAWVLEQRIREALAGVLSPRSVRARKDGVSAVVEPADWQSLVTGLTLQSAGFTVAKQGAHLIVFPPATPEEGQ